MYYLYGVLAYLFAGSATVAFDAYLEYRQKFITKFDDYNRQLAIQITLLWPFAWAWSIITTTPGVMFWVIKQIGGNPILNIKASVGARKRQKGAPALFVNPDPTTGFHIPQRDSSILTPEPLAE